MIQNDQQIKLTTITWQRDRTCNVTPVRASAAADLMFVLPLDDRACAACWLARTSDCRAFTNARPTICTLATTICAMYLACHITYNRHTPVTSDISRLNSETFAQFSLFIFGASRSANGKKNCCPVQLKYWSRDHRH